MIQQKLDEARRELLELSTRSRLLHTPRGNKRFRGVEVHDERGPEVWRLLVDEGRTLTFLPDAEARDDEPAAAEPAEPHFDQPDEEPDDGEPAEHHLDNRLQTRLSSEALQKKLLRIYYDARTFEQEQGVNILYLAVGFLEWYEDESSTQPRYAPLLLAPVQIERTAAREKFSIAYTGEDVTTNLSLAAKLKHEFRLDLPGVPEEGFSAREYFEKVAAGVAAQGRWRVWPHAAVLSFFSFAKYLMLRDLDSRNWPQDPERNIAEHPLVQSLLLSDRPLPEYPPIVGEDDKLDALLPPGELAHVTEADSSQAVVIEEVARQRSLVVQGPPGTGKSQTITNLIAAAVRRGRRVLFVAEKVAALEVVKRRLDHIGLGAMCLELHSQKAQKKRVLEDLQRTLELTCPRAAKVREQSEALTQTLGELNAHAERMHRPLPPANFTPYRVLGELVRLRAANLPDAQVKLPDALRWDGAARLQRRQTVQALAQQVERIGTPATHAWRGVTLTSVLPFDIDRVVQELAPLLDKLRAVQATGDELAHTLGADPPASTERGRHLAALALHVAAVPDCDAAALADGVWDAHAPAVADLVRDGAALAQLRGRLRGAVAEAAWGMDWSVTRRDLAAHGRSWFRWFFGSYRRAVAALRGVMAAPLPGPLDERLALIDSLIEAQSLQRRVDQADALGRSAFGHAWRGSDSDWALLDSVVQWSNTAPPPTPARAARLLASHSPDRSTLRTASAELTAALDALEPAVVAMFERLRLDLPTAFGCELLPRVALADMEQRLEQWRTGGEALSQWVSYHHRACAARDEGLASVVEHLYAGRITPGRAVEHFDAAYFEALVRRMFEQEPALASFDGRSHEQVLERFRQLDRQRLTLARQEVAMAHYAQVPRNGTAGEVAVLRREFEKQRRHLPLRQLLRQAGTAVTAIKPVFMMSPISVAQFLEPGAVSFDLLVIDEASQVRPVDALGAVARCRQIVVVGDDKQLPPTTFFDAVVSEESAPDDEASDFAAGDTESILGLARSQGLPSRMLRWHYRSRHESLIRVSNHEFYDNRLFIVPSPVPEHPELGLRFHHVSDGVFDRGKTGVNRVEARRVAEAVLRHAVEHPELTLGVGAFSVRQRDAIIDELELLLRTSDHVSEFFNSSRAEPFFVKNLENIQGDERDVIYISVGYGRDASGYMAMNFGPLSGAGGERRLNVLITRARLRCEVFSSITAEDIDLHRVSHHGPRALRTFLHFARAGVLDLAEPSGRGFDSPFEEQVARAVESIGLRVAPQVGSAGFFIDLAVIDPERPGRYLLGVECDGASYHSARWARDRDRLRQQVLEDHGWTLHRIWSADWFARPQHELRRLAEAVERARLRRDALEPSRPRAQEPFEIEREEHSTRGSVPRIVATKPYTEASFKPPAGAVHELPVEKLGAVVVRIVETEGPVHRQEVARRVTALWGLSRTGARIAEAVDHAVRWALEQGRVEGEDFLIAPGPQPVVVRDRSEVASAALRRPEMLPPTELATALLAVIVANPGLRRPEAFTQVARLLGLRSAGAQLREVLSAELDTLVESAAVDDRDASLYTAKTG